MADTSIWIDESRFIFDGEHGKGDLHAYILVRTDDHLSCPHYILGWAYKNFGKENINNALHEIARHFDKDMLMSWERKAPPENQYGKEITAALAKADNIMKETLGAWHQMGIGKDPNGH